MGTAPSCSLSCLFKHLHYSRFLKSNSKYLIDWQQFFKIKIIKSYVACMFGIHNVGLSFILCGIWSSLFSFLVSQLTKIANKTLILVAALSSTIGLMVYIYSTPSFTKFVIVYFIPMLFGLFEGVWGTIINSK